MYELINFVHILSYAYQVIFKFYKKNIFKNISRWLLPISKVEVPTLPQLTLICCYFLFLIVGGWGTDVKDVGEIPQNSEKAKFFHRKKTGATYTHARARTHSQFCVEEHFFCVFFFHTQVFAYCILVRLKSQSVRGASHHPVFMGNSRPTISHTFFSLLYPVDEFSFKEMKKWG